MTENIYRNIMQDLVNGCMYGEQAAKVLDVADVVIRYAEKAREDALAIRMDGETIKVTHELLVAIVRSQGNIMQAGRVGNKITAIKELRTLTGVTLKAAKAAIDEVFPNSDE